MEDNVQPTILVKKADGTSVRMTLAEFKEYKKTLPPKPVLAPVPEPVVTPAVESTSDLDDDEDYDEADNDSSPLPIATMTEALATSTPVTNIFVDEAAAKFKDLKIERFSTKDEYPLEKKDSVVTNKTKWTEADHQSPLEEKMEVQHQNLTALPNKKEDEFKQILSKIKFPVRDDILGRLHSLIASLIKGVRTEEQIKEYGLKSENFGGLGWNEAQVEALLLAVKQVSNLGMQFEKPVVQKSNPIVSDPKISVKPVEYFSNQDFKDVVLENKPVDKPYTPPIASTAIPGAKPMVQDIVKAVQPEVEKKSIGPLEELKNFTLTDFRRLGSTASQSADVLKGKFEVIKKDSYLQYMEAISAWSESPLYLTYQGIIKQSLETRVKISDILADIKSNQALKFVEFEAIVDVNAYLNT